MPSIYTPNQANNPAQITLVSDGDGPIKAADVNTPIEGVADKIVFTQNRRIPFPFGSRVDYPTGGQIVIGNGPTQQNILSSTCFFGPSLDPAGIRVLLNVSFAVRLDSTTWPNDETLGLVLLLRNGAGLPSIGSPIVVQNWSMGTDWRTVSLCALVTSLGLPTGTTNQLQLQLGVSYFNIGAPVQAFARNVCISGQAFSTGI
jgi:hypothetical protein